METINVENAKTVPLNSIVTAFNHADDQLQNVTGKHCNATRIRKGQVVIHPVAPFTYDPVLIKEELKKEFPSCNYDVMVTPAAIVITSKIVM